MLLCSSQLLCKQILVALGAFWHDYAFVQLAAAIQTHFDSFWDILARFWCKASCVASPGGPRTQTYIIINYFQLMPREPGELRRQFRKQAKRSAGQGGGAVYASVSEYKPAMSPTPFLPIAALGSPQGSEL